MSTYVRALIEAAIRNGVDVTAAEVAALLADRDRLAAERNELLAGRAYKSGALLAERDQLAYDLDVHRRSLAETRHRTARALAVLDCTGPDLPDSPVILDGDALAPIAAAILRGER